MRRAALSVLSLMVLACSKEQAGVQVLVNYTENFKTGCFSLQVIDPANPGVILQQDSINKLTDRAPQLKVAVVRREGWGERLQFTISAHEQTCDGPLVDQKSADLDLSGEGLKTEPVTLTLTTPDADGDGYVPTANGGSDCNDASAVANPAQTRELCDGLDNDCKNGVDDGLPRSEYFFDEDGDGVGAGSVVPACVQPAGHVTVTGDCNDKEPRQTPGKMEDCNDIDDDCDAQTDEGFDKAWYLDSDGDSFGDQSKMVTSCTKPSEQHVRATSRFDCRDDLAERNPNAQEKCNGEDDDCSGMPDERFMMGPQALGASCVNQTCTGTYACNQTQDGTACNAPAPTRYYADLDGDGEGAGPVAQLVCPGGMASAGRVTNTDDCDDADPGTRTSATEVCDAIDNNCDGTLDAAPPACSGFLRRIYDAGLGGDGHQYRTVALDPTDGYPVWVAGLDGRLSVRRTQALGFEILDRTCGDNTPERETDWYAAWVNPATGNVFLAGELGRLAEHSGTACVRLGSTGLAADNPFTSIMGVGTGADLTLFMVAQQGRLFSWRPGNTPVQLHNTAGFYRGLYVLSPELLLAVGTVDETASSAPRIREYVSSNWTGPTTHGLNGTTGYVGSLQALWMTSASQGVAVGDDGLVLKKDGAAASWTRVAPPPGATPDFTSVALRAGSDNTYIVDNGAPGRLWRLTSFGWAKAPSITPYDATDPANVDRPLYDIAMTSTGEFWMVGDGGRVYHYPQP